jgi:hypothetical protein
VRRIKVGDGIKRNDEINKRIINGNAINSSLHFFVILNLSWDKNVKLGKRRFL